VAGKAKLQDEKQQIDSKQQDIERLKTKLAAQEELKTIASPREPSCSAANTDAASAPPQS